MALVCGHEIETQCISPLSRYEGSKFQVLLLQQNYEWHCATLHIKQRLSAVHSCRHAVVVLSNVTLVLEVRAGSLAFLMFCSHTAKQTAMQQDHVLCENHRLAILANAVRPREHGSSKGPWPL